MSMMEKMMSGMMKPEDMPKMMDSMMDNMFSKMSAEDRIQFVSEMTPKCINTIFSEIDSDAKQNLAREMLGKMASIFEEQLKTDDK
ncbi:MAG: hypothetical protein GXO87_04285 [Chlorobi bacterium]|nr:hypothetical protein [Chlorobiota bacterium]